MKYSFKKINIESPFPTTQCGHSCQTNELFKYHDHLFARVTAFNDGTNWIIHFSMDLLAFDLAHRNELQEKLREFYKDDSIHVITSTTHTHYANSVRNPKYVEYLSKLLYEETINMNYQEIDNIKTTYQKIHSNAVGKSRISHYDTGHEYLGLIRFYSNDVNFLNIIYYNCHPTILDANVPYFSAEYPGYVLKKLEDLCPNTNFTFFQGAAGDISSRFVRDGQNYEALEKLGNNLLKEINDLMKENLPKIPFMINYKEVELEYKHEFTPIDLSNMRQDLTDREKETIRIGQEERAKIEKKANLIFGKPIDKVIVTSLDIGTVKFIFYPNEIFTEYMNSIDLDKELLVSYSNGYGPYILPIDFPYITYEMFMDTLTRETKENIKKVLSTIE